MYQYARQFYKYRKLSLQTALFCTFLTMFVQEFFKIYGTVLMYPVLSVMGDIVFYKILKKKESETLPEDVLQSTFNITGTELDAYATRMSKVRLFALLLALTVFAVIYAMGYKFYDLLAFALTYISINAAAWLYANYSEDIKQPKWQFNIAVEESYDCDEYLRDLHDPFNPVVYFHPGLPLKQKDNGEIKIHIKRPFG